MNSELWDLLNQDVYTDAAEYRERVERIRELLAEEPEAQQSGAHRLMRYADANYLRDATNEEWEASVEAAKHDGGAGVIKVEGVSCYVED